MTPERWNEVSDLFKAVMDREPRERTDFLAAVCLNDGELRAEVESLLAEDDLAGNFLSSPASPEAASALRRLSQDQSIPAETDPYLGVTLCNRYRIETRLARGGQALVYRARDTVVMSRPVVIKIFHSVAGQEAWPQKKFQKEMEALARIDHPGIVGVLDTGELPGAPFLVVQYVDGVTLRQELEKGPLEPVRGAAILRQIGAALEAAHAQGIAHRDLKPENIMLQRLGDGKELVKLIDFGIAKIDKSDLSANTTTVMVAGTVRYMAPEQFRGDNSNASDVYALGLIACEVLSGQPDLHSLKAPAKVREHIQAALAYRPQDRPHSASEFCNQVAEALTEPSAAIAPVDRRRGSFAWLFVAALLLATFAVAGLLGIPWRTSEPEVELSLTPPEGTTFGAFALSPDGLRIAMVAAATNGKTQLWVRTLASLAFQPLAGTEGANYPFWSPDGRFIGFFAGGKLKKIEASGGPPQTICIAEVGSSGGAWNRDGVILFTPNPTTSLYRVSAAGGEPAPVTALDSSRGESSHSWPQFMPDGNHFLFFVQSGQPEASGVYIGSLDSTHSARLLAAGSNALYASGYLLFERERTLIAQPFDDRRFQLTGAALPVAENVGVANLTHHSLFSVSDNGGLVYDSNNQGGRTQLVWFDRQGNQLGGVAAESGDPTGFSNVNLSPDGTRIAVDRRDEKATTRDIWVLDQTRGGESRLTFDPATDASPIWSPDGRRLIFFSSRQGTWQLYSKDASGAGTDELLLRTNESKTTCDWSRDGRNILFRSWDPRTKWDLWVLPLDREPFPIVRSPLEDECGQFSPNGRWLAYVSDESGRKEVYVQPFSSGLQPSGKWQISTNGGAVPRWRRDGKELLYLDLDNKLMAVSLTGNTPFQFSPPKELFQTHAAGFQSYDVTPDGQRFLVNTAIVEPTSSLPTVVLNWTAALKRAGGTNSPILN
jgi:Tol biopolymer transport system component/tRNA A-37 threonylcarbamoyl transferase component Bud32